MRQIPTFLQDQRALIGRPDFACGIWLEMGNRAYDIMEWSRAELWLLYR